MQRYEHGGNIYGTDRILLDFSANLNPLGMPGSVRTALTEDPSRFEIYPDPDCTALRKRLAEAVGTDPEDILMGNGADDMIYRLAFALRPREVLLTAPGFSEYEKSALQAGARIRYHELSEENGFAVTEAFAGGITDETDLVYLCTPNNPTGNTVPEETIRAAADRCRSVGALLVVDECFLCFTDRASCVRWLEEYPCLVVLDAFTKRYAMAGLRLGYLVSRDHGLLERLKACGPCWNVSGPAQAAGLAALDSGDYLERSLALIREERLRLAEEMSALGLRVFPPEANFVFFQGPETLYEDLLGRGILIRSCDNYPGLGPGWFRVCVHTHEKNERLLTALREVLHG